MVFGKNDNKKRFLGSLLYGLNFNKKIRVSINSQIRDFLYVEDLCRFVKLLILKKKINIKGNILNITAENWINMSSIFSYFSKNIQNKLKKLIIIYYPQDFGMFYMKSTLGIEIKIYLCCAQVLLP